MDPAGSIFRRPVLAYSTGSAILETPLAAVAVFAGRAGRLAFTGTAGICGWSEGQNQTGQDDR